MESIDMVTRKTVGDGAKAQEECAGETSTEKFLRECAERAALPEPKKIDTKPTAPWPFPKGEVSQPNRHKINKRKSLKILRKVCPWMIRPEEIRKEVFTLVRKGHSFAFAKQLTLVLSLSFKVSDYFEQLGAMNPLALSFQRGC
jgi:hypothetical protein